MSTEHISIYQWDILQLKDGDGQYLISESLSYTQDDYSPYMLTYIVEEDGENLYATYSDTVAPALFSFYNSTANDSNYF